MPISCHIQFVTALEKTKILVKLSPDDVCVAADGIKIDCGLNIRHVNVEPGIVLLETAPIALSQNYELEIPGVGKHRVDLGPLLDELYSEKPLGATFESGKTIFRVFAPRAKKIVLALFDKVDLKKIRRVPMRCDEDGVWEVSIVGDLAGAHYGYEVVGPGEYAEHVPPVPFVADPYAKAVSSKNDYLHESKSIIVKTDHYDWQGDTPLQVPPEDLIIYEAHVRDMTMHPSSGVRNKGTYAGFVEKGGLGGFSHICELGVNAVELLPCQHFAKIEPPYHKETGRTRNSWNPYVRNHWGYMTSHFFAPEPYYAEGGHMRAGEIIGASGEQIREFKDMVKALHQAGIAVIMDVVYNHVSNYDLNPLKYLDKTYYFRLNDAQAFLTESGCGNDFKTERKMARRLIVDSVKYWLEEFHIDGLRFDLAAMLDWVTIEQITLAARKINPDVTLIAEPWGGGKYDLASFSERGWLAWNDLFRNGVKGRDPVSAKGLIFGHYYGSDNWDSSRFYVRGSRRVDGGPFEHAHHSLNYLESHDGYTLGDFIRIGMGAVRRDEPVVDLLSNAKLTDEQLRFNKFSALFLLTSQGVVMLHQGQEFARSKVIAESSAQDPHAGRLDHDSYEKDNETNWLNFAHKELNRELFDYYRGLISLRKRFAALRKIDGDKIVFLHSHVAMTIGFHLPKEASGDAVDLVVLLNANRHESANFELPHGVWRKVVDADRAGIAPFGENLQGAVVTPPGSGLVLICPANS